MIRINKISVNNNRYSDRVKIQGNSFGNLKKVFEGLKIVITDVSTLNLLDFREVYFQSSTIKAIYRTVGNDEFIRLSIVNTSSVNGSINILNKSLILNDTIEVFFDFPSNVGGNIYNIKQKLILDEGYMNLPTLGNSSPNGNASRISGELRYLDSKVRTSVGFTQSGSIANITGSFNDISDKLSTFSNKNNSSVIKRYSKRDWSKSNLIYLELTSNNSNSLTLEELTLLLNDLIDTLPNKLTILNLSGTGYPIILDGYLRNKISNKVDTLILNNIIASIVGDDTIDTNSTKNYTVNITTPNYILEKIVWSTNYGLIDQNGNLTINQASASKIATIAAVIDSTTVLRKIININ